MEALPDLEGGCFNTQPPEGGWGIGRTGAVAPYAVSTHSRPKAAGSNAPETQPLPKVSTHSHPKAAGLAMSRFNRLMEVSTHSRPKAAGYQVGNSCHQTRVSTHSRPKAAGLP